MQSTDTSLFPTAPRGAAQRGSFRHSSPRVLLGAMVAGATLVALAHPVSAAPQAADLEHFIIGEAALALGDCGAVMAQQSAEYAESSTPAALARTSALLAMTSGVTSQLSAGLFYLCHDHGMPSCEAAAAFESASADLARASGSITDGDYALASESLARATDQLEAVFAFNNENGVPDSLRESYRAAIASLDDASAALAVLADQGALSEIHRFVSTVQNQGLDTMLKELQVPADFAWPAGFLGAQLIDGSNYPGKWAPGTLRTTGLSHPLSQQILDSWSQQSSDQLLQGLAGSALLLTLHEAGSNLRDAMYGLRAYIHEGHEVGISCVMACQTDDDCAPCTIVDGGFGFAYANPDDIEDARRIIRLMLSIEVKRRGFSQPSEWLRDAVKEAIKDLLDQLRANSGHLYIRVEKERCVISMCWIFWEESECVKVTSDWIKVPLPVVQLLTPPRMWGAGQFRDAERAALRAAKEWCNAN